MENTSGRSGDWTGLILILVGVAFLLNTLGLVELRDLIRFWPVLLIAVGVRMVIGDRRRARQTASSPPPAPPPAPPS